MGLKTEEVLEGMIELSKAANEIKNSKAQLHELKQNKAQIERDIALLKKIRQDEQAKFEKEKAERQRELAELDRGVEELRNKRVSLATITIPEIKKLESLKEQIAQEKTSLNAKEDKLSQREQAFSKEQSVVEKKKAVIEKIKELSKEL